MRDVATEVQNLVPNTRLGVTMSNVLSHALQLVAKEREGKFNEAFAAAALVASEFSQSDIAERIVSETPLSVPWEVVADLLGILQWSTEDNGAAICRATERWLIEGSDTRKIQIALNLDTYPFQDDRQMRAVLERIAEEKPEVAARCRTLISERMGKLRK